MKTTWEKTIGPRQHYIDIQNKKIILGSRLLNSMTDNAGQCSHKKFLNGEFHNVILKIFGPEILQEIINTIQNIDKEN